MHVSAQLAGDERRHHRLGLLGLVVGLAIGGTTLLAVAGPPRLPAELPNRVIIASTLNGSYLPPEAVAYVVTTAAWMIWGWLTLSLALRLIVLGAEAIAYGAAWVRALRLISDRVTLPVVRRLVDGAVVTVLVVNLMARAAPASAAPISYSTVMLTRSDGGAPELSPNEPSRESSRRTIRYTVQPGDTLWTISERFYGTGFEYGRLVHANSGRPMVDGSRFTRTGVIQQGWTIDVPLPSRAIEDVDGRTYYVVDDEDTLRGVAARLLGNEAAWCQIFEANRETARLPDGRALTRPDLIWPGLRLLIPIVAADDAPPAPSPAPTVIAEAPPSPSMEPGTPAIAEPSPEPTPPTPEPSPSPEAAITQPSTPPTVTPVPTDTLPPAEPSATAIPATTNVPAEAVGVAPTESPSDADVTPLKYGAAALAAFAAAGGAVLVALRRARRRLVEPWLPDVPEEGPESNEGFAEPELARVLEHRLHGGEVEPAVIVADQAVRFFEGHDLGQIDVVTVGQRRTAVSLTLNAGLAAQPRLLEITPDLGQRLGGSGDAWRTTDHDVMVRVSGLKVAGLSRLATGRPAGAPILLPIGVLPGRETLYANWREFGHVLVAGLPGGGAEIVLTSLIGALTARCRPEDVRLVTIASRRSLPSAVLGLPHQSRGPIDPTDEDAVTEILQELRTELDRRMQRLSHEAQADELDAERQPEIIVVIGELADIAGDATTFELLGVHGAANGIRLLSASTRPEAIGDEVLAHFATRVALQSLDEDASIRLIGRPDAADLGGGGDLLIRIDGRVPLRARGFRLSPEHLDQLVRVMREAYAGSTDPTVEAESTSRDDVAPREDGSRHDDPPEASRGTDDQDDPVAAAELVPVRHGRKVKNGLPASGVGLKTDSWVNGSHAEPVVSDLPGSASRPGDVVAGATDCSLPIQVRCFGSFRVTSGDHDLSANGSDGAHYKAWDILAFLCAQPGGTVSRERLVAALWPEVVSKKAANRLKVSLVRLRSTLRKQVSGLTGEVVRVERNGVCHLDADCISSDVHRFMELCKSASKRQSAEAMEALEEARALYRGDLLTEPYYEWVHTRGDDGLTLRELYREEYFRVTQRLAELHRQQGQPARAVALYRDILKLEPTLEDVVRSLYRCYQELGDRGALLREHRRLQDALRQLLKSSDDPDDYPELYEPESETVALYEEALAALESRATVGPS
ncbi:MAG: LysM peptidoglycan-binding domain-containing protein [Chloroflexi bacterium]|nr:LysM peptidoglycan-binding domain-containing protein [Chloroflexota bacterium]